MQFYKSISGFLYIGDMQPGDRLATPEEITEHLRDKRSYAEKRAAKYPSSNEYLDALVKINSGDADIIRQGNLQLGKYYQDCLDVKSKYPKI